MPKFKKNTSPAMYKKPSSFKMEGFSGFGNSPVQKNFLKNLTKPGAVDNSGLSLGPNKPNTFKSEIKRAWKNVKNPTPRGFTTPAVESKIARAGNWIGKNVKVAGRLLGGVGIGLALKDMYTSGQKHSGGKIKKNQKQYAPKGKFNINKGFKVTNKGFNF